MALPFNVLREVSWNFKAVEHERLTGLPLSFSIFWKGEKVTMSTAISADHELKSKPR